MAGTTRSSWSSTSTCTRPWEDPEWKFVPSREELRGTWLNLRVFKDQLAAVPTNALLLSRDDREFYEIAAEDEGNVLAIRSIP